MATYKGAYAEFMIMEAGEALFAEKPYDEVTVRQLCQRAKLANGSFFNAVTSKQALAAQLYLRACRERDDLVREAFAVARTQHPNDAAIAIRFVVKVLARELTPSKTGFRLLRRLREAVRHAPAVQADPDGLAGLCAVIENWLTQPPALGQVMVQPARVVALLLLAPARAYADLVAGGQALGKETLDQLAERVWTALRAETAVTPLPRPQKRRPARTVTTDEPDLFSRLEEIQKNRQSNEEHNSN